MTKNGKGNMAFELLGLMKSKYVFVPKYFNCFCCNYRGTVSTAIILVTKDNKVNYVEETHWQRNKDVKFRKKKKNLIKQVEVQVK